MSDRLADRGVAPSAAQGCRASDADLRELVTRRLRRVRPEGTPRSRMLANVVGPVSPEMLKLIEQPARHAAVLLALVERTAGWTVLFTERTRELTHHAGQICFPGGRLAEDDEQPVAAALREAWEEVGLKAEHVEVVGSLPPHLTGTGFVVTPVVGFVAPQFRPRPDPAEVAAVFEVPLSYVLDPANLRATYRERLGTRFRIYELTYDRHLVWGATAAMLKTFIDLVIHE